MVYVAAAEEMILVDSAKSERKAAKVVKRLCGFLRTFALVKIKSEVHEESNCNNGSDAAGRDGAECLHDESKTSE